MRYRHRPVGAVEVPQCGPQGSVCLCVLYLAVSSRLRTQTAGKVGFTQVRRKLQLSGMPKLIGQLRNAPGVFTWSSFVCLSVCLCTSKR